MKSEQYNTTRTLKASQEFTTLVILSEKLAKQILFSSISDEAGETLINLCPVISGTVFAQVNFNWIFNLNM